MDEQLLQAGLENFNLPHDVVKLPSEGRYYKSKKKSVKVGYLTAADENFIVNAGQNNSDMFVLSLIRNKLYEPELKPEELLPGDVETILLQLRTSSFGPEYHLILNDPKTNKPFDHIDIIDEINFKPLTDMPDENGHFTTTLPKSGVEIKLRLLTYAELMEINSISDSYPSNRVAPVVTTRLLKQIVSIDNNSDRMFISSFVNNMLIMDSKYIKNFLKDRQPSLDLKRIAKAPSGEKVSYEITFGVEFFRPFF